MLTQRRYIAVPENQSFSSGGDTRPVYSSVCGEEGSRRIMVSQNQSFTSGGSARPVLAGANCFDNQNMNDWRAIAVPQNQFFTSGGDTRPVYSFACCPPQFPFSPYPVNYYFYLGNCFVLGPLYCTAPFFPPSEAFLMPCTFCLTLGGGTCTCLTGDYTLSIFNGLSGGPRGANPYWKSDILTICGATVYFAFFLDLSCTWFLEINCNGISTYQAASGGDPNVGGGFIWVLGVYFDCGSCHGTYTGAELTPVSCVSPVSSTACSLSISPTRPNIGATATFLCRVAVVEFGPAPQGTVTFYVDGTSIGTATITVDMYGNATATQNWTATCTPTGEHTVTATYNPVNTSQWATCNCSLNIVVNCYPVPCCPMGVYLPDTLYATVSNVSNGSCLVGTYQLNYIAVGGYWQSATINFCGGPSSPNNPAGGTGTIVFVCNYYGDNQFTISFPCTGGTSTQGTFEATSTDCSTPLITFTGTGGSGIQIGCPVSLSGICGYCDDATGIVAYVNVSVGL